MGLESKTFKAFWQTIIRFDAGKITVGLGIRNAVGVMLPLVAALAFGAPGVGIVGSTGALNVSFSDGDDPYSRRARRMLAASLLDRYGHSNENFVLVRTWDQAAVFKPTAATSLSRSSTTF